MISQKTDVKTIAVMTSGGDAPGMNATIRAVVRWALHHGLKVYGIRRGWLGAVEGGEAITEMKWKSVGGILQRGGTILGTARCDKFRTREGRLQAAIHLYQLGVDALVVIGGDGSLTGATVFRKEWPDLLKEAAARGIITLPDDITPQLAIVGLPGSIDNDIYGSDMSIGADTALHRIVTAADQLTSTAAAHQRTFVMEVMGRNCGYLALAGALAANSQWVIIPEEELDPYWRQRMLRSLERARESGRQHALVVMAEGARHLDGLPLSPITLTKILSDEIGEARLTVLGHIQRGGAPGVFDRILATRLGAKAVDYLLENGVEAAPVLMGLRRNKVVATPLDEVIVKSRKVGELLDEGDYQSALDLRGVGFRTQLDLLKMLIGTEPRPEVNRGNLLIVTSGHDAPGMNPLVRVATRMAMTQGFQVLGAEYGLEGLLKEQFRPLGWMDVTGWMSRGGSELGTGYYVLKESDLPAMERILKEHEISALLLIGGSSIYKSAHLMASRLDEWPGLAIPTVITPLSINNNLPSTDFSVGADTALNNVINAVDKLKDNAGANKRLFIVQVMGYHSGYLALASALASGAEDVFIPEEGITLSQILEQVQKLRESFAAGRRLAVIILNEVASQVYDINMIQRIMEQEGGDLFDVRSIILGHIQRGGAPSPFDRTLAARFGAEAVKMLAQPHEDASYYHTIGLRGNKIISQTIEEAMGEMDWPWERQKDEWFMKYLKLVRTL